LKLLDAKFLLIFSDKNLKKSEIPFLPPQTFSVSFKRIGVQVVRVTESLVKKERKINAWENKLERKNIKTSAKGETYCSQHKLVGPKNKCIFYYLRNAVSF
jgi:hypothetical protein